MANGLHSGLLMFLAAGLFCAGGGALPADADEKALELVKVWPQKLVYRLGEDARYAVDIKNNTREEQRAQLEVSLVSELDRTRLVYDDVVQVAAGATRELDLTWNTGNNEYGFELLAVLKRDGEVLDLGQ